MDISFKREGFEIVDVYDGAEVSAIEGFAKGWIYNLLAQWVAGREADYPLEKYHQWSSALKIDHANTFRAKNRHTKATPRIMDTIINAKVKRFLADQGVSAFEVWDEGLGWLAFRFIRPGAGDGYPMSRKAWGPAKNVISCWIPVIGFEPRETITLVPGSHLKEYKKYLPENSKFMKGEYRLAEELPAEQLFNPRLKKGQAVFYHPGMLHTEDIKQGDITRLSLEFRVEPKNAV